MFRCLLFLSHFFFFNATATTEIYTLSLHDALPISLGKLIDYRGLSTPSTPLEALLAVLPAELARDRKSTRLNSSHLGISYAVFCLKKKKKKKQKSKHTKQTQHTKTLHQNQLTRNTT